VTDTSYLDTNVIVACVIEEDTSEKARALIEEATGKGAGKGELFTSTWAVAELHAAMSRIVKEYINEIEIPPEIGGIIRDALAKGDRQLAVRTLVGYALKFSHVNVLRDQIYAREMLIADESIPAFWAYFDAARAAWKLGLKKIGDLMQVAYAAQAAKDGQVKYFLTLDKEIIRNGEDLERYYGLKVLQPPANAPK